MPPSLPPSSSPSPTPSPSPSAVAWRRCSWRVSKGLLADGGRSAERVDDAPQQSVIGRSTSQRAVDAT